MKPLHTLPSSLQACMLLMINSRDSQKQRRIVTLKLGLGTTSRKGFQAPKLPVSLVGGIERMGRVPPTGTVSSWKAIGHASSKALLGCIILAGVSTDRSVSMCMRLP